jgi:alpha-tubulin suppressor-like RCC1 family protein
MIRLWKKYMAVSLLAAMLFCSCQGTSQDNDVDGGEDAGADAALDTDDIVDGGINLDAGTGDASTDILEPMEPVEYVDLSAGEGFTCGVRNTGAVDCWGDFREHKGGRNLLPPADIRLKSVSAGKFNVCGVSADDGTVICWGSNVYNESIPLEGVFRIVSTSTNHTCGLRPDGNIECWGDTSNNMIEAPQGEFVQVSSGWWGSCALNTDGSIECWPERFLSPEGIFSGLSQGLWPNYGIRPGGTVNYWDVDTGEVSSLFDGTFTQVTSGSGRACALATDSTVECVGEGMFWGEDGSPEEQLAEPPFTDGLFGWISVGEGHSCGIRPDGQVACYGADSHGQSTPTEGIQFRKVTAGGGYGEEEYQDWYYTYLGCGLDVDGRAHCWATPFVEYTSAVANYEGRFKDICSSMGDVCGLTENGSIICSGLAFDGFELSGEYESISCAGSRWSLYAPFPWTELCALDKEGLMTCWLNGELIEDRTVGPFTQVSVGGYGGCGIRPDGHLECFLFRDDVDPYPDGEFIQVEVGTLHSCGVHKDGTVECFWSDNTYGQATPPPGEFTHVTTGFYHSCGLRKDRTIECWGRDFMDRTGETIPPTGEFISLDAGTLYTCGIRPNGALKCWGKLLRGLTQADF